jgi:hypothetical protein
MALFLWVSSTDTSKTDPVKGSGPLGLSAHGRPKQGKEFRIPPPTARWSISAGRWPVGNGTTSMGMTRDVDFWALGGQGLTSGGGRRRH